MGMTNREKFREVYGFDTDCGKCNPYPCEEDDCEWWEQCKDHPGCPCENWWDLEYKAPADKNDIPYCQCTDAEIAKSFIEDVEAVTDQLPCGQQMDFPNTFDEFAKDYGFRDKKEIYTNGSELIPVFRVKQWLEHISITKNDLGVDCISREAVERIINKWLSHSDYELKDHIYSMTEKIHNLPTVTRQEPRWIPVSERLPEENKTVIASTEYEVCPETRYTKEDGWEWAYESGAGYWEKLAGVKAWMPLPEPYKAD